MAVKISPSKKLRISPSDSGMTQADLPPWLCDHRVWLTGFEKSDPGWGCSEPATRWLIARCDRARRPRDDNRHLLRCETGRSPPALFHLRPVTRQKPKRPFAQSTDRRTSGGLRPSAIASATKWPARSRNHRKAPCWPQRDAKDGPYSMSGGKLEPEMMYDGCQHQRRLLHRERRADAGSGTGPKRDVCEAVHFLARTAEESGRVEVFGAIPQKAMPMQHVRRDHDQRTAPDRLAGESVRIHSNAADGCNRWI